MYIPVATVLVRDQDKLAQLAILLSRLVIYRKKTVQSVLKWTIYK